VKDCKINEEALKELRELLEQEKNEEAEKLLDAIIKDMEEMDDLGEIDKTYLSLLYSIKITFRVSFHRTNIERKTA
jgi:hypothetical protein